MAGRKRRGRGEGSISQRANGLWEGKVSLGYDGNGKRKRVTVFGKTKAEVQEKLRTLVNRVAEGMLTEPNRQTVGEYLAFWLEDVAKPAVRRNTHGSYERTIRLHIRPHLGGVRLGNLTPAHVQSCYAAMEREGTSPRLRQLAHAVLHRALHQAVRWGFVPRNVCDIVDPPRVPKKAMRYYTPEQVRQLFAAAEGHRLGALIVLAVTSGLRQGELFGLLWEDVDLDLGTIKVQRQLEECGNDFALTEPKSASGRRQVVLPAVAVQALQAHRKLMEAEVARRQAGGEGLEGAAARARAAELLAAGVPLEGPVFPCRNGGWLRKSNFTRQVFKPLLKAAGLPEIRFHDLRHTHATLLLAEGTNPRVVQERLGHKDITLTLGTYSHVLPTLQKEAAAKLDGLFGSSGAADNALRRDTGGSGEKGQAASS